MSNFPMAANFVAAPSKGYVQTCLDLQSAPNGKLGPDALATRVEFLTAKGGVDRGGSPRSGPEPRETGFGEYLEALDAEWRRKV